MTRIQVIPDPRTWRTQRIRLGRFLVRLRELGGGTVNQSGPEPALDAAYAFFVASHHMADWLGNDPASGVTFEEACEFRAGDDALRLSADVAVGDKHSTIRNPKVHVGVALSGGTYDYWDAADGRTAMRMEFEVEGPGIHEDGLEMAERCYESWRGYLVKRGLDPSEGLV